MQRSLVQGQLKSALCATSCVDDPIYYTKLILYCMLMTLYPTHIVLIIVHVDDPVPNSYCVDDPVPNS